MSDRNPPNPRSVGSCELLDASDNRPVPGWLDDLHIRAESDSALAELLTLLSTGDLATARRRAEALVAASPEDAEGWYLLSVACADTGELSASLAACDRCTALAPSAPEPHVGRGWAFERMGRDDLAAAAYGDAIALDPQFGIAWTNLILACLRAGDSESALLAADAAIEVGVNDPHLRYQRAEALARQGRAADTIAELELAIKLDPSAAAEISNNEHFAALLDIDTLMRLALTSSR